MVPSNDNPILTYISGDIVKLVPPLPPALVAGINGVMILLLVNTESTTTCVIDSGT